VGLADHTILRSKSGRNLTSKIAPRPLLLTLERGLGVVLFFRDITTKKLAEEETSRQKDLLQLILGSVHGRRVVADTNGKFSALQCGPPAFIGIGATDVSPDQWSQQYGTFRPDGVTVFPRTNCLWLARCVARMWTR